MDRDWLFVPSNLRKLINAADDAAEMDTTPVALKRQFIELENVAEKIEKTLRRLDI